MPDTLERIYNSALKFLGPLSPEKTYEQIVSEATKLTQTKWGTIYINNSNELLKAYSTVPVKLNAKPRRGGYTYKAHKTGQSLVVTDVKQKSGHPMQGKAEFVLHVPLVYNDKPYGVLNLISDKKLPDHMRSKHELKLFSTMASLAIRKAQLYNEKKDALARRDLFLNIASHELKTPLTSIFVYSELLKRKFANTEGPEKKWSQNLHRETIRLTTLVSELLSVDLAKTGSLRFLMKKYSMKKVAERAIAETKIIYPYHRIELTVSPLDADFYVKGDKNKLLQVILNLLSNACKFSPINSIVKIYLRSSKDKINLKVADRGKGIPEESLKKIFDIFYKENSNQEGMGLGLYLVRKIVERHGGEIKVKSRVNFGTTFEIIFPKAP